MSGEPRSLPDSPPIGRSIETARLAQLIDDTAAGAKRAVILLGAPGIGKTTLLRWARSYAEESRCITASVRIPAAAGLPPRYPLGHLADALLTAAIDRGDPVPERLKRVASTLNGSGSNDAYAVAAPQFADALEDVGRLGPLVILIDDYHWAPAEAVDLLIAALRTLEAQVCLVASARLHGLGEDGISALPEPSADLWIEHLEIRGLDRDAVAAVAAATLGGDVMPSLADALYTQTFGNPLFLNETVQSWRNEGLLTATGGFWGLAQDAPPPHARSLRDMIAARLARMDRNARSVVRALAAIGREADFGELSAISEIDAQTLVGVIERLHAEQLILIDTAYIPRYRLAHALFATSILDEEGTPQRTLLHTRIFDELRRRKTRVSAAELAHHAVRALTRPSDVREILTAAAEEAEAAGSAAEAAVWYGYLAEEADDPRGLAKALRGQAVASIQSDPQRATALFTYALGIESDRYNRARLLLGRARALRVLGNHEGAISDLHEALPLAAADEVFDIRHAIGAYHGMLGRLDEAESVFRDLAVESAQTADHAKAIGHLGMVALIRGSIVDGTALMEEALGSSSDDSYATYLRGNLAWLFSILGRWDDARDTIARALDTSITTGDIYSECSIAGIDARLSAWCGDLAHAFDRATRARRLASRLGNPSDLVMATDALASALVENEMYGDAAALLTEILELEGTDIEEREMAYSFGVLAEACVFAGDIPRARIALGHARAHLASAPFWEVALDRCDAQIDLACGDPKRALGRIAGWLEEPTEIVLEHANVRRVAAHALNALGDRKGAAVRAREALETYERLGAVRMAARATAWLDQLRPPRGRPKTEPGQLTSREAEILRLVVLGRSNQGVADELVISIATVKKHLENIMAKAGVSRRTELVPFAIDVGVLATEELVRERESVRERSAGALLPRPRGGPVAPRSVRPARREEDVPRPSERPAR